jgi:hypothetical protein
MVAHTEKKQSLIVQLGSHISPTHFHPHPPPPPPPPGRMDVWPSTTVLYAVEVAIHSTSALLLPSVAVAQVKCVFQVLVGVAVSSQPGLVMKSGNPEMVCTGQGGRLRGAGPTQPQVGVKVKVGVPRIVTGPLSSVSVVTTVVIDVTNGTHRVDGVGVGAPMFGTTVIAKMLGSGFVRVIVVDPEGPKKLV